MKKSSANRGSKKTASAKRKQPGTILAIDVGGTHVKVMDNKRLTRREFVSGPHLSAKEMVKQVKSLTADWSYDVVSIGYPGPVAHDRCLAEPHNLGHGWTGFNFVNDALMQAVGSYQGGRMLFLGLGTGLGSAMIVDGVLEPMELGHLPYRKGRTFEDYLGAAGLKCLGKKKWRREVADVVKHFVGALEPDYIVLGGGNAEKLGRLPKKARLGDNANAFKGGFRLWDGHAAKKALGGIKA
jgi:polyphosphate glucokinase